MATVKKRRLPPFLEGMLLGLLVVGIVFGRSQPAYQYASINEDGVQVAYVKVAYELNNFQVMRIQPVDSNLRCWFVGTAETSLRFCGNN